MKPRWRYDWKCNWAWRRVDGRFQVLMPGGWLINADINEPRMFLKSLS